VFTGVSPINEVDASGHLETSVAGGLQYLQVVNCPSTQALILALYAANAFVQISQAARSAAA
jgi:hypothetical protein